MATDQPDRGLRGLPGGKQKYSAFALAKKAMNYHQDWQRAWRDAPPQSEYDVVVIGGGDTAMEDALVSLALVRPVVVTHCCDPLFPTCQHPHCSHSSRGDLFEFLTQPHFPHMSHAPFSHIPEFHSLFVGARAHLVECRAHPPARLLPRVQGASSAS